MTWTDCNVSFASDGYPLHSGICGDVLKGNTDQLYQQSGYLISSCGWSTDSDVGLRSTVTTAWKWYDDFEEHVIPVRNSNSTAGVRNYKITIAGDVTGAETVTVRCCMFPTPQTADIVSDSIFDTGSYVQLDTFGNLGQTRTGTIVTPETIQFPEPRYSAGGNPGPLPSIRVAYLKLAVKATGSDTMLIGAVTIEEVIP